MSRFVDQFFIQMTGPDNLNSNREQESGDKSPVLVLLHGVMGYALNWRRVAKQFESQLRVLTYDSRGHGRSQHADLLLSPDAYSPKSLAEDLRRILDDLNIGQVFLVGHSMGGRVAYTFACQYPERVKKLVIEDIGPEPSKDEPLSLRVLNAVPVPFVDKRTAKAWFDSEFPKISEIKGLAAWLYANITDNEPGGRATWRFHVEGIRSAIAASREPAAIHDGWECIKSLSMRTLLIRGEFSKELLQQDFEKMTALNENIKGVEISDAGHWIHSEQFEAFTKELKSFFGPGFLG